MCDQRASACVADYAGGQKEVKGDVTESMLVAGLVGTKYMLDDGEVAMPVKGFNVSLNGVRNAFSYRAPADDDDAGVGFMGYDNGGYTYDIYNGSSVM